MNNNKQSETDGRISDQAVRAKTGKTWAEWFAMLDAAGAASMNHKEIVAYLAQEHDVTPWWRQSVTVAYEQARGLRQKHQMPDGYQISRSKTIAAPAAVLYNAWLDEDVRRRWLPDAPLTVRKTTENKTLRLAWEEGNSTVDVQLYPRGDDKTQVVVQHNKLPDADEATRMKAYWAERLAQLQRIITHDE
jgi:uncharacterized protein YndB with AHSA1/START domain